MPAPQDTTSPVDTPQVTAPVGHNGIRVDIEERPAWRVDGILAAVLATLTILALGDAIALARNAYFSDHDNFTPWPSFSLLLAFLLGAIAVTIWASLDGVLRHLGGAGDYDSPGGEDGLRLQAAMAGNLLVVLCSDSRPTPVINTSSLY